MFGLQGWHLLIVVLVILLLFGARKLPDLARSVGQSMKIFRSEIKSDGDKPGDAEPGKDAAAGDPSKPSDPA
jgi:sec-independent protein translocase protein TatA